jgi:DNA-binding NtrC family response regulator
MAIGTPQTDGNGPSQSFERTDPQRSTVLVIDDQADVRCAMADIVDTLGYYAVTFSSGQAALDHLIAGHHADAAMIDLIMPGMKGPEAIAALRALRPDLAILLVSGHPDLRRAAEPLRKVHLLHKPFHIAELDTALHAALSLVHRAALH